MTHAHLNTPFPAPHKIKRWDPITPPRYFNPKNADLIIIDEDLTATMIDAKARKFRPEDFEIALPAGTEIIHRPRRSPSWKEPVELTGGLIVQALNQKDPRSWARAHGITPAKLWQADRYCRSRERTTQPLGNPQMPLEVRKAMLKGRTNKRHPHISKVLRCLAIELGTTWDGPFLSLRKDPKSGEILFRARPRLWNMSRQKVIVLDGTALEREVQLDIPEIKEVRIEVPRNAVTILVYDEACSKKTLLTPIAKVNGEPRYKPTERLLNTFEFAELCGRMLPRDADDKPRVAATMIKAVRQTITGNWAKKLPVSEECRGVLIGHTGNTRGSNDFKDCEIGVHIGRLRWPVETLEADGCARYFDSSEPLARVEPNEHNRTILPRRPAKYRGKPGVKIPPGATVVEVSYHPDPKINDLMTQHTEREREQGRDRLRLIHNEEPKLEFLISNIEPPDPVDMFVTHTELNAARLLFKLIETAAAPSELTGGERTIPLVPTWLHEHLPELWPTVVMAKGWVGRVKSGQTRNIAEKVWGIADRETLRSVAEANKIYTISVGNSSEGFKPPPHTWTFAEFRCSGTPGGEWSLCMYRGNAPSRRALGAELAVAPESLEFRTRAGESLAAAEDTGPATGDARLDQLLTLCAAGNMALPLAPEPLAVLPGSPFRNAKQAENWKAGVAVREIFKRGPPEGWSAVAYRLKAHRGRKPAEAWIPTGLDPQAAIAAALSASPTDITILTPEEATPKHPRSKPHIVEEPFLADPVEFIVTFGVTKRAWPPHVAPRTTPLSFLDLLRPEEGEGVLLMEENCGEPKPSAARPGSSPHVWIH
jgi:hypothetical protein